MRSNLLSFCSLVLLIACSSPKHTYHFDSRDYSSGKKPGKELLVKEDQEVHPLTLSTETLIASTDEKAIVLADETTPVITPEDKKSIIGKYSAMSKKERKNLRKELKSEIKKISKKNDDSVKAVNAMDNDAKLAIIFGGIGVILLLLPGQAFLILGAISLIIGFVFFVKWISRQ